MNQPTVSFRRTLSQQTRLYELPKLGRFDLLYQQKQPLPVEGLSLDGSIMNKIATKDYLISAPYQSFAYLIKLLREAALDPKVTTIKITLYV